MNTRKNTMKKIMPLATMALSIGLASPGPVIAQTANDLVGTWTNVSNVNIRTDLDGNPLGPHQRTLMCVCARLARN
jgi:hypothetical protein